MKVEQISIEQINENEDDILYLIKEAMVSSFPSSDITIDYCRNILWKVKSYLAEGKAIVFVAYEDGIQGWMWCHAISRMDSRRLHVAYFSVKEKMRGKGVGHILMEYAEAYAQKNNFDGIDLLVTKDNTNAVYFYEKNGFEIERYLMKKMY